MNETPNETPQPANPEPAVPEPARPESETTRIRRERRMQVAFVPFDFAVFLVQAGIKWRGGERPQLGALALPVATPAIPADAVVCQIQFAVDHDAFMIVLAHRDWPPVPLNESLPAMPPLTWEKVRILHVAEH